jgi:hypothetical protein
MKKQQLIERQMRAVQVIMEALDPLDPASREAALKMAMIGLAFELPANPGVTAPVGVTPAAATAASANPTAPDPRSFMRSKNPLSDVERVACLAYYLTHVENRKTFRNRDLVRVNLAADGPQLNMRMAAQNAMRQNGYLASAAGVARQITTRGERVVEALPNRDAVKQALMLYPKPAADKKRSARSRRVA